MSNENINSTDGVVVEEMRNGFSSFSEADIRIRVSEPVKKGEGMGAFMVYTVFTKTSLPSFRQREFSVTRRFSDFLGLHDKFIEKHLHYGYIIPPAPEKSVVGMTKLKMSKDDSEFVERRMHALERFLNRTAAHKILREDPNFKEFLEYEGDLAPATNTRAVSTQNFMKALGKVGDAVGKMTFKMEEQDGWFEEKHQTIDQLDQQLRKLHQSTETLALHRRGLSLSTQEFSKSCALLANVEEHTALARALSQLAETEEKIEEIIKSQADSDLFTFSEMLKDYIGLLGAAKQAFQERIKAFKTWKEAEHQLTKKRETKVKFELAQKTDKIPMAEQEITEWEEKVENSRKHFNTMSDTLKNELEQFEIAKVKEFKQTIVAYLEHFVSTQQKIIYQWEAFLPEAKAIS